jgi:hypothetical protein
MKCLGVLLCTLLFTRTAFAAGAVETVAQEAAHELGRIPPSSVVVAAPLLTDQIAPRGEELALRVATLVAGRLGAGARGHAQTAQLATARALAGRASALVYVQTEVAKGDLRATVDVYPSMANAWDRIRNPLPSPTGHAFSTAKIDAEVRAFLAPLMLEQASVHRARHDEGDVLAVACGDLDGDGGDELVLVSRARVAMGRVKGGRFVVERSVPWSALAPSAPVTLREPLAGAVIAAGALEVGTTDRGAVRLTTDLAGHAPITGLPAWGGDGVVCLAPQPSAGAFEGAPFDCDATRASRPRLAVPAPRFDAFAAANLVDAAGSTHSIVAVREPSGKLRLEAGETQVSPDGVYGAELAVLDLDEDGVPEVATSVDGAEDALNVWTWPGPDAELRGRLHLAAPGGVRALAVCPSEEHGQPALVAVVGGEVWLVRAGVLGAVSGHGAVDVPKRAER